MSLQPVLIAGEWRQAQDPAGSFSAVNPSIKTPLPESYPVSSLAEVEQALAAGKQTATTLRAMPAERSAHFLELFADNEEGRTEELVALAHLETGLPVIYRPSCKIPTRPDRCGDRWMDSGVRQMCNSGALL
ncbi:MAG: hypothetical protein GY759_17000 [Chloroflexi bacterium]|nr:hypothetical protein [Chloroflexota bacterium]